MSWRQRGSAVPTARPSQTNRPVYEDFDPKIDTNENEGARIVVLHVPGFQKEQMKITSEQGNNIRVQGQRLLTNNKWIRFNQLVPVPTSCNLNKIHAKHHNGILTITMPKEAPRKVVPPTPQKPHEKTTRENVSVALPEKSTERKAVPPLVSEPIKKAAAAAAKDESKSTGAEKTSQKKTSSEEQKTEKNTVDSAAAERSVKKTGSSPSPQKGTAEPKGQKSNEAKVLDLANPHQKASIEPKEAEKGLEVKSPSQSNSEIKSAHELIKKQEDGQVVNENSEKAKGNAQKEKESAGAPSADVAAVSKVLDDGKNVTEKLVSEDAKEKPKGEASEATHGNKLGIKYIAETAKQTVANMAKKLNDDDRQLLINIGSAVMVLVALGAYISYGNFGSSMENEN